MIWVINAVVIIAFACFFIAAWKNYQQQVDASSSRIEDAINHFNKTTAAWDKLELERQHLEEDSRRRITRKLDISREKNNHK